MTDTTADTPHDDADFDDATRQRFEVIASAFSTVLDTLGDDLGLGPLGAEFAATWRAKAREDLERIQEFIAHSDDTGKV